MYKNNKKILYHMYFLNNTEVLQPVLLVKKKGTFKFLLISFQRHLQSIFMRNFYESHFYEIHDENKVVGVVWITTVNKYRMFFLPSSYFEVTIIINKYERNKGYGHRTLIELSRKHLNLVAFVRSENLNSVKLFNGISQKSNCLILKEIGILGSVYKSIEQQE